MTRKVFIVLLVVILLLGVYKVQAIQRLGGSQTINVTEEKLEDLIEINEDGIWKNLDIDRYIANNANVYKLGNNSRNNNSIRTNTWTEDAKKRNVVFSSNLDSLDITNEKDKYMATKIALDCVNIGYKVEEIKEHYRVKEGLSEELKTRAETIIKTIEYLVDQGYNREDPSRSIEIKEIGNLQIDKNTEERFQNYELVLEGEELVKYEVTIKDETDINCTIVNSDTEEPQNSFNSEEPRFKVVISKEDAEKQFGIRLKVDITYLENVVFDASDGSNDYIVFGKSQMMQDMKLFLGNQKSDIFINFIDKQTRVPINGGVVNINGNEYEIKNDNRALLSKFGGGNLNVKIVSLPEEYISDSEEYELKIEFGRPCKKDIILSRKRGSLEINSNIKEVTYEIYNLDLEVLGTYSTDNGTVLLDEINAGKYILGQTLVEEGYELVKDVAFSIEHGKKTEINIMNDRIDKTFEDENEEELEEVVEKKDILPEERPEENDNMEGDDLQASKIIHVKNNLDSKTKENKEQGSVVLPRTGNDYFIHKLIIFDLIIFGIFLYFIIFWKHDQKQKADYCFKAACK